MIAQQAEPKRKGDPLGSPSGYCECGFVEKDHPSQRKLPLLQTSASCNTAFIAVDVAKSLSWNRENCFETGLSVCLLRVIVTQVRKRSLKIHRMLCCCPLTSGCHAACGMRHAAVVKFTHLSAVKHLREAQTVKQKQCGGVRWRRILPPSQGCVAVISGLSLPLARSLALSFLAESSFFLELAASVRFFN